MQVQNTNKITKFIYSNLPISTLIQIISFLDISTLASINSVAPKNIKQHQFLQLVRAYYFISNCLNKTDRALYYSFYDEPQFRKLQINLISTITEGNFKTLEECYNKYNKVVGEMNILFNEDIQVVQQIENSMYDPFLPLPKLRRENVGMYCNSAFQYFLTDIKYGMNNQEEIPYALQDLKNKFKDLELESKHFTILVEIVNKNKDCVKLIKQMRLTPFLINSLNMESYYIKQHQLHNLLVILFAATDLLVSSSQIYVSSIKDPYHQFVQFNLRYNIFKNYVLDIQQKFSFAFQMYGDLYQQILKPSPQIPKFSFWRPAMTKWVQKMSKFHKQNQRVYFHLVTKLRSQQNKQKINKLCEKQPQLYIPIRNKMEMNEYQMNIADKLYSNCQGRDVQQYFQNNPELYQMLGSEYMEYIIDLSVNEHTVHWCGHSQHVLEEPYKQFQIQFMEYNQHYFGYLEGVIGQGVQKHKPFRQLLKNEVLFLQAKLIKPVTLNRFIQLANIAILKKKNENKMMNETQQLAENQENPNNQQIYISYDFQCKNAKLKHFNEKAEILKQIAQNERCFYSIVPLCSPEKILENSIDTRHTDNLDDSLQDLGDYFSQSENESVEMEDESQQAEKKTSYKVKNSSNQKKIRTEKMQVELPPDEDNCSKPT